MKEYLYVLSVMLLLALSSCENLDQELEISISEDQVFSSYDYTKNRVNSIYSELQNGFTPIDDAMMASITDEAEFTIETSAVQSFNTGFWNATSNPDNAWSSYFRGIRKANQFLGSADNVDLESYRLNPSVSSQEDYQRRLAEIENWKVEVRFLRAYFYFELVKRYGSVPIITEYLTLDDNYLDYPRKSLTECIDFIVSECDSTADKLNTTVATTDLGRVTKGAALALKSRALLYAASDLYSNASWAQGYSQPELITVTGERSAKWKKAGDAAKAVIDLNVYSLSTSYSKLFEATNFSNNEVIFCRRNGATNNFELVNTPIGYDKGKSGNTPSQNLVDAYEMNDGTPFDWSNPVHAATPYVNRDPRLKISVLTNNTPYKGRPVEIWTGGLDGKGKALATKTGYYMLKYVNPTLDLLLDKTSVHSWVYFRLAEIYLNYAEALNEYDPGNTDIALYVNRVRGRAGVNMPALPVGLSQDEMRQRIRNERMVELAFEGHRLWDVKRWMIGDQILGGKLRGVEITNTGGVMTYNPIDVESRTFDSKMYFYPIPQSELNIKKDWVQNPLW